jgi:hypothetical protein
MQPTEKKMARSNSKVKCLGRNCENSPSERFRQLQKFKCKPLQIYKDISNNWRRKWHLWEKKLRTPLRKNPSAKATRPLNQGLSSISRWNLTSQLFSMVDLRHQTKMKKLSQSKQKEPIWQKELISPTLCSWRILKYMVSRNRKSSHFIKLLR